MDKRRLQHIAEDYVAHLLSLNGHTLVSRNVQHNRFEFDIISIHGSDRFVHEVRGVSSHNADIRTIFPTRKLLTLIRGSAQFFPTAKIQLHLVRVLGTTVQYSPYELSDLL